MVLVLVAAAFLTHSGRHRAALVASALPLGLVPLTLAVSYASHALVNVFSGMAATGSGGVAAVTGECRQVWAVARMGALAFAVVAIVALLLTLVPMSSRAGAPPCSGRRAVVLLVLPLGGALLAAAMVAQVRSAVRVANALVLPTEDQPARKALVERVLESEGLSAHGSGAIADISAHVARGLTIGTLGGLVLVVVLLGLSLTGALIAAPVRVSPAFVAAASSLWLVAILAAGAAALGWGDPLRLG
jgi:hypothetical protein